MSWVMHKNVAVAQRARAAFSSSSRRERSSPQKGSSKITRRAAPRQMARPSRTRWPSPPESKAPPAPRGVCKPIGRRASTSSSCAPSTASPTARCSPSLPKRRFSSSERFHNCTAGSTHRVWRRNSSSQRPRSSWPSTCTLPASGRYQPSNRPTRLDLPAPDEPTIATCSPAARLSRSSASISLPAAFTRTSRRSTATPGAVDWGNELSCASTGLSGAPSGSSRRRVRLRCCGYCWMRNAIS